MSLVFVTTLSLVALSSLLRHVFALSQFGLSSILLARAALLYLLARRLHLQFLHRSAVALEGGASESGRLHGPLGVPRWVQALTNVAFGTALAALIPLVEVLSP